MKNIKYITALTHTSEAERDRLALTYRKFSDEQKIEIEEINLQTINSLRSRMDKEYKSEFYYACRIISIKRYLDTMNGFSRKQDMSEEQLQKIQDLRIQFIKSKKKKDRSTQISDIIRIRYDEITQLRSKGLSWRDIANYMQAFTKTKIHFTYLRKIYYETEMQLNG